MRKIAIKSLFGVMLLLVSMGALGAPAAAPSDTVVLYFRIGSASYDLLYRGNSLQDRKLQRMFTYDTTLKIKSLVVVGGASPEGNAAANLQLARSRAQRVLDKLKRRYSWIFVDERLLVELRTATVKPIEEWENMSPIENLRYVAIYVQYEEQPVEVVVAPVAPEPEPVLVPELEPVLVPELEPEPEPEPEPVAAPLPPIVVSVERDSIVAFEVERVATPAYSAPAPAPAPSLDLVVRKPLFALKTNLLFDLVSALNLEIEVPIGRQWSIAVEGVFPWWLWDSKQLCLQMISGHLEGRYWFDKREDRPLFTGWFIGLYGGYGYYDFEFNNQRGVQGEFRSVGISGGYGHRIGKNLSLEYSLGLGYAQSGYRNYEARQDQAGDCSLYRLDTRQKDWFGPTRLKVSLVWLIHYNKTTRTK